MEINLIWHDPNAFNQENNIYYENHLKELNAQRFSDYMDASRFLHNERKRWIVITSGSKGKELMDKIEQLPSVLAVIFFCNNKQFHENWSKNYPIVKGHFSDIDTLKEKIKSIHKEYIEYIVNLDYERQKQQLQQIQLQLQTAKTFDLTTV
jgi:hypothetical protein